MFKEILDRNNNDVKQVIANWDSEINRSVSGIFGKDEKEVERLREKAKQNLEKCGAAICDEAERTQLMSGNMPG